MGKQVVVDLETWGLENHAIIISIGAVAFEEITGTFTPLSSFHQTINPDQGRSISVSTLLWWMHPDRAAAWADWQKSFEESGAELDEALYGFAEWLNEGETPEGVWGNGVLFDNAILNNAYKQFKIPVPWGYRQDQDYRTLKGRYPSLGFVQPALAHNALNDAMAEARHLHAILQHIRRSEIWSKEVTHDLARHD